MTTAALVTTARAAWRIVVNRFRRHPRVQLLAPPGASAAIPSPSAPGVAGFLSVVTEIAERHIMDDKEPPRP